MKEPEFAFAPLLTAELAADPLNSIHALRKKDHNDIQFIPFVSTIKNSRLNDNKHCFALQIQDDSMLPTISTKDIVMLDPDQKPKPGDLVAAKIKGQSDVIIRQYKQRSVTASFETFELIAFNTHLANIIVENPDTAQIVGVVCQSTHIYS